MDPNFLRLEDNFIYGTETNNDGTASRFNFDSKMLAHRFSLKGTVPVTHAAGGECRDGLLTLTGFSHICTATELCQSLAHFIEQFCSEMPIPYLNIFQKIYHVSRKALRQLLISNGYPYNLKDLQPRALELLLRDCKEDIAIIHSGYFLHAVCITIVKGSILYRSNKGGCNFGNDVVEQYRITKPEGLTIQLLEKLMNDNSSERNKSFIHKDIHQILGLELIDVIKGKLQTVGNCSWASKKAGIRALIHHLANELVKNSKDKLVITEKVQTNDKAQINALINQLFKIWTHFDRRFNLQRYINQYRDSPTLPYMLRRMLCTHFESGKDKDLELGKKLIAILKTLPNFAEGYVEFLISHWQFGIAKATEKQTQFSEFMHLLGIDIKTTIEFKTISEEFPAIVQLFSATMQNDVKKVDEILRSGIMPAACVYLGWTPLHIAVANGHHELVDLLSKFEPKWANSKNSIQRSPLFYAKDVAIAKQLLDLGSNIDDIVDYEDTPLNTAASQGNLPLVQLLVSRGAKFNNETLHFAARSGCVETGRYLLQQDPKLITRLDYDYYHPIHTAAELGHQDFVQLLLQLGSPTSPPDVNGNTPIHLAARFEKEHIVTMLAELPNCQLAARNYQNRTLMAFSMHQSDKKWHHELARAIQDRESAVVHYDSVFVPDYRMSLLKTPEQILFGAVRVGDIKAVRGCLERFPSLDITAMPKPFSHDALQEAIFRHRNDIFDLLMKIPGINVNSQNGILERPLHCAVACNNMHALNVLLLHPKIEINATDDMGYTPLHDAAERGRIKAVELLLQHVDIDSMLINKKGKRADEIAKLSLLEDCDIAGLIKSHQQSLLMRRADKLSA